MAAWHSIDSYTSIKLDIQKRPLEVKTTRRNLNHALDDASQWYGEPLEEVNEGWRFNDEEDPTCEAVTKVACSADLHEEKSV